METNDAQTVRPCGLGLALGSGAIRGLAHIGVLKALDKAGIKPDLIVGASAGALIGALYCVGVDMDVLECFAAGLSWRQLADPSFKGTGMIRGERIHALIRLMTKNRDFADCSPAFAAIATDICTGERVLLREGNLADALRASISIPGVFRPFDMNGRYLADGGIVGRIPIAATRELGATTVVAVDVVGGPRIMDKPSSIFEVIVQSVEILESEVARASLGHADVVVVPEIAGIGPLDLGRARELVAAGERAMEDGMPELIAILEGGCR